MCSSTATVLLAITMAVVICSSSVAVQGMCLLPMIYYHVFPVNACLTTLGWMAGAPDGDHEGSTPPSPQGGKVHHMCPEEECDRPSAPPSPTPPRENSPGAQHRKTLLLAGTSAP
jgi:hypothetical protein